MALAFILMETNMLVSFMITNNMASVSRLGKMEESMMVAGKTKNNMDLGTLQTKMASRETENGKMAKELNGLETLTHQD